MLKIVFLILVAVIAVLLVYASTKPDSFRIERHLSIKASPEKIFPLINDFHAWEGWTPYNKDKAMTKTYSGPESGVGAASAWDGNKEVGKGDVAILESLPPTKIVMDLHMIEPFEGHNRVEFTLVPEDGATRVTWAMNGPQPYTLKVMGLFMSMDKMVGRDFEVGLSNLKTLAEKS